MSKTRRGFLAALALLPGVGLFRWLGRGKWGMSAAATERYIRTARSLTPFKFRLWQKVKVRKDGQCGVIVGRSEHLEHWDGPGWAARRYYTCRMEPGAAQPLRFHYGEDELEALPVLFVIKVDGIPIAEVDTWSFAKHS